MPNKPIPSVPTSRISSKCMTDRIPRQDQDIPSNHSRLQQYIQCLYEKTGTAM